MIESKIDRYSVVAIVEPDIKTYFLVKFLSDNELVNKSFKPSDINITGIQENIKLDKDIELKLEGKKISITSNKQESMMDKVNNVVKSLIIEPQELKLIAMGINFDFRVKEDELLSNFKLLKDHSNSKFINFEYIHNDGEIENRLKYYLADENIRYNFNNHHNINSILSLKEFDNIYNKSLEKLKKLHKTDDMFYSKELVNNG